MLPQSTERRLLCATVIRPAMSYNDVAGGEPFLLGCILLFFERIGAAAAIGKSTGRIVRMWRKYHELLDRLHPFAVTVKGSA